MSEGKQGFEMEFGDVCHGFEYEQVAREDKTKPTQWAYCILANVYSLWFMHLPTMIECYSNPRDILNYAYKILVQMNRQHLTNPDEVNFKNSIQC